MPPWHCWWHTEGAAFESRPCTNPRWLLDYGDLRRRGGLMAALVEGNLSLTAIVAAPRSVFESPFEQN